MTVRKYSLTINQHRTSISLEVAFYEALGGIARERGLTIADMVAEIDAARRDSALLRVTSGSANVYSGLSSAIRVYVLDHFRRRCEELDVSALK